MTSSFPARDLSLRDLETKLNLRQRQDPAFFPEWQNFSSPLAAEDRQLLDRAKLDFLYLAKDPIQEEIVKLVVLAPLLAAAGFYRHPFRPVAERQVEIAFEESGELWRGRLDVLVVNERLWVTVIESKSVQFNVLAAVPQALFYMNASPHHQQTFYGLATNGSEFLFLKLARTETPEYGFSRLFSLLNPGNELYDVVGVLQRLGESVAV